MKTDYTQEIIALIKDNYTPATPETPEVLQKSLQDFHEDVINVLPAKWIDGADVYNALQHLEFKTYPFKDTEGRSTLLYFVTVN